MQPINIQFEGITSKLNRTTFQLNDDSCSESEVKEDDDLGTESSRSRHTIEAEQKKKKKRKSHRRSSGGKGIPPKSSEDNAEDVSYRALPGTDRSAYQSSYLPWL